MVYTLCWGLMVLVIIAVSLHMTDQADKRRIEKADRDYQAALDAANDPEQGAEPPRPIETRRDVRDWSRRHENGPEIAKSEGVSRERRHH